MPDYDILQDTFCTYCQVDFDSPEAMQDHVMTEHADTYAAASIRRRRKEQAR